MNQHILKRFLLLFLISSCIYFGGNNLLNLTDPDEVFYCLTAKEMSAKQDNLTPYIFNQPQFEKPILTYWLIQLGFGIFGQNAFAARFFPALFAVLGVLGVYALGLIGFLNERRAFLSAIILGTSAFYLAMGKTVFTDMIFSVLILYSLLSFYLAYSQRKYMVQGVLACYAFAGLAVLAKGPVGFLVIGLTIIIFLLYKKDVAFLNNRWHCIGGGLALLICMPWYLLMWQKYGQAFVQEFFYNDHIRRVLEAEHKGNDKWFFYPVTMLAGLFPWSLFLLFALKELYQKMKYSLKPVEYFLVSWVLVVLFSFQFVHSKLASYILPMFPALALLAANFIEEKLNAYDQRLIKRLGYALIVFLGLLGVFSLGLQKLYVKYIPSIEPIYWLSASLLALAGTLLILILKDKLYEAIQVMGLSLIPIFITVFMAADYIEPHVSMKDACNYIPSTVNHSVILSSKPYARGIRYYTGQDIAVMDINGKNYFSPHPIPILNTKESLLAFLKSQERTFAVLKKSSYQYIIQNFSQQFQITVLKVSGPNYVLKIQATHN